MNHYLIAYDISLAKNRRKIAKIVYGLALGGQKSALETVLSSRNAQNLSSELALYIDEESDKVNIVKVMPKAIMLGKAKQLHFNEGAIII